MNTNENEKYEEYIENTSNLNDATPVDISKYRQREEYTDALAGTYEDENSYGDDLLDSTASAYERNDETSYDEQAHYND